MKQIKYTKEQELVIELVKDFFDFVDFDNMYDFEKQKYFAKKQEIYAKYGIKEKYLTLRDYINKYSCGSYNRFYFNIDSNSVQVKNISSVDNFERIYNPIWLDKYYVINVNRKDDGNNQYNHYLELAPKED